MSRNSHFWSIRLSFKTLALALSIRTCFWSIHTCCWSIRNCFEAFALAFEAFPLAFEAFALAFEAFSLALQSFTYRFKHSPKFLLSCIRISGLDVCFPTWYVCILCRGREGWGGGGCCPELKYLIKSNWPYGTAAVSANLTSLKQLERSSFHQWCGSGSVLDPYSFGIRLWIRIHTCIKG